MDTIISSAPQTPTFAVGSLRRATLTCPLCHFLFVWSPVAPSSARWPLLFPLLSCRPLYELAFVQWLIVQTLHATRSLSLCFVLCTSSLHTQLFPFFLFLLYILSISRSVSCHFFVQVNRLCCCNVFLYRLANHLQSNNISACLQVFVLSVKMGNVLLKSAI